MGRDGAPFGHRAFEPLTSSNLPRHFYLPILDLFHVNERLWTAAHCFHAEASPEAEQFVERSR